MNDLLVVSCNMMNPQDAHMLVKSCEVYGYPLQFYGHHGGFYNFRQIKIDMLLDILKGVHSEYVMYTDAFDSWFLKPNILEIYKTFDKPVVVSGNKDHYPHTTLYTGFPEALTSFRYICCSQFIGPTDKVIQTIETIRDKWSGHTDQEGWHYCYVNGWIDAEIDHYCKLFLNMTRVTLDDIDVTGNIRLKETNIEPASIHFGGPKGGDPNEINMKRVYEIWRSRN